NSASTTFTMPGNAATITANFSYVSSSSGSSSGSSVSHSTVSFNSYGGSKVNSQTVTYGAKATKPADPTKEGYTFAGWYTDAGLTVSFDFSKGITGNTTLYAKWIKNTTTEPNQTPSTGPGNTNQQPTAPPGTQPSGPSGQWHNPFSDVKSTDWFYGDVQYALLNNLFKGASATSFAPNGPMTRGMFVTVLWRASGSPTASGASQFKDVPANAYYSEAVRWAARNNIVLGISNTLFAPDRQVTREQMAAILYRYEQFSGGALPNTVTTKQFADANKVSNFATKPVNALTAQGIIGGKPGNLFDPQGTATRAEVSALMHRFMAAEQ
ncbi:MAG: S-layer homology domain-containing protein, partial [Firmicutes bacterium]|nr:S-layer homology domain-containing protein [Bacillota bacterium]